MDVQSDSRPAEALQGSQHGAAFRFPENRRVRSVCRIAVYHVKMRFTGKNIRLRNVAYLSDFTWFCHIHPCVEPCNTTQLENYDKSTKGCR